MTDNRWRRFEGYQDLIWSLELLLRDILKASNASRYAVEMSLIKLRSEVIGRTDLPSAFDNCLREVIDHRNVFVHALKWEELDGDTYLHDLECVKVIGLWYLRDCVKGPRLNVETADRMITGGQLTAFDRGVSRQIFVSYALEDAVEAQALYSRLEERGHNPWMDKRDLLPGQEWEGEIRRAIQASDFFIALMSSASVTKKGFVQKEIRYALDVLGEVPPGRIWFIPVRLEVCEVPDTIKRLQWVDLKSADGYPTLLRAIENTPRAMPSSEH